MSWHGDCVAVVRVEEREYAVEMGAAGAVVLVDVHAGRDEQVVDVLGQPRLDRTHVVVMLQVWRSLEIVVGRTCTFVVQMRGGPGCRRSPSPWR